MSCLECKRGGVEHPLPHSASSITVTSTMRFIHSRQVRKITNTHTHGARNRTRVVDAMWETGETWVERGKNIDKKGWLSSCRPR